MSQLDEQLQSWRNNLSRTEVMRGQDVEELEQHVRDSIAELTLKGLNEEEAFLIATRRVGEPGPLGTEFRKVHGDSVWTRRVFWMLAGFLFFEISGMIIMALSSLGQALAALAGGSGTTLACLSIVITLIGWAGAAMLLRQWARADREGRTSGHFLMRYRGKVIAIAAVASVILATLMRFGSQVAILRLESREAFGRSVVILAQSSALFALLIPAVSLVVMLMMRQKMRIPRAVEQ